MKKVYEQPKLELLTFYAEDVMGESNPLGNNQTPGAPIP